MSNVPIGLVIDVFAVLGALFAIWKGGPAERATATVVIVNVLVGQAAMWLAPSSDGVIRLVNDGLTALVLLGITVRYAALWMGGVMLFFAVQFSMHSYYLVTARPNDYLHALINNIDFSGIILCMLIGTVVAWRGRAKAAGG
jgi:hypothetical protein